MTPSSSRTNKAERLAEARESARLRREQEQRIARRNGLLLRGGVIAAVVVLAVGVVLAIFGELGGKVPEAGPAPRGGNAFGGIALGPAGAPQPLRVDAAALPAGKPGATAGIVPGQPGEPVPVVAYVDTNCTYCAKFEARYAQQLSQWVADERITFEYRNVAYRDQASGTDYSTRGASALACVADESPELYPEYARTLFATVGTGELDDGDLAGMATELGGADISRCLEEGDFLPWVNYTTAAAEASGIKGTPTVYVDGREVPDAVDNFEPAMRKELAPPR